MRILSNNILAVDKFLVLCEEDGTCEDQDGDAGTGKHVSGQSQPRVPNAAALRVQAGGKQRGGGAGRIGRRRKEIADGLERRGGQGSCRKKAYSNPLTVGRKQKLVATRGHVAWERS